MIEQRYNVYCPQCGTAVIWTESDFNIIERRKEYGLILDGSQLFVCPLCKTTSIMENVKKIEEIKLMINKKVVEKEIDDWEACGFCGDDF